MDPILERARAVRLLVLDVDGVLTDGRLYLSAEGEELKVFHVRDGYGLVAVQRSGVTVAIISGRDCAAVTRRAAELGIAHVMQGVSDKAAALDKLMGSLAVDKHEVACVGDDTPDIAMLRKAGLPIAVADAHPGVISETVWSTTSVGGQGAVREICDLLLSAKAP